MLAVSFAASTSLSTPIGFPHDPDRLRFGQVREITDFVKIGTIMNVLTWILTTLFIPFLYPV